MTLTNDPLQAFDAFKTKNKIAPSVEDIQQQQQDTTAIGQTLCRYFGEVLGIFYFIFIYFIIFLFFVYFLIYLYFCLLFFIFVNFLFLLFIYYFICVIIFVYLYYYFF